MSRSEEYIEPSPKRVRRALTLNYSALDNNPSPQKEHFARMAKKKKAPPNENATPFNHVEEYEEGDFLIAKTVYEYFLTCNQIYCEQPIDLTNTNNIWKQVKVVGINSFKKRRIAEDGFEEDEKPERKKNVIAKPYYHVFKTGATSGIDLQLLQQDKYEVVGFILNKLQANSKARVDDVMALMCYNSGVMKVYPKMPEVLESNHEMDKFFKKEQWQKFTLEDGLDGICVDAVQFITRNIINRPRNVSNFQYCN